MSNAKAYELSANSKTVALEKARVIGISPTSENETDRGRCSIRFAISEPTLETDHLQQLEDWYHTKAPVSLKETNGPDYGVDSLRDISYDPSSRTLYVELYSHHSWLEMMNWFDYNHPTR